MFRLFIKKIQSSACSTLKLGPHSTANKIYSEILAVFNEVLANGSAFHASLIKNNCVDVLITDRSDFEYALAMTLDKVMAGNYSFYQSLSANHKHDFRANIIHCLLQALDNYASETKHKVYEHTMHDAQMLIIFNLPASFRDPAYLEQLLSECIQESLQSLAIKILQTLHADQTNYMSLLPGDILGLLPNLLVPPPAGAVSPGPDAAEKRSCP